MEIRPKFDSQQAERGDPASVKSTTSSLLSNPIALERFLKTVAAYRLGGREAAKKYIQTWRPKANAA